MDAQTRARNRYRTSALFALMAAAKMLYAPFVYSRWEAMQYWSAGAVILFTGFAWHYWVEYREKYLRKP